MVVGLAVVSVVANKFVHSDKERDEFLGVWYGSFSNADVSYDYIAEHHEGGVFKIAFRFFDVDELATYLNGENEASSRAPLPFEVEKGEGRYWIENDRYFTESSSEEYDGSLTSRIFDLLLYQDFRDRYEYYESYVIDSISDRIFEYSGSGRSFWKVAVDSGFEFPPIPLSKEEMLSRAENQKE